MARRSFDDEYAKTSPNDVRPIPMVGIEIEGEVSSDVDGVAVTIQSMAKRAGLASRGPIPLPTKKLDCGKRTYFRRIYVDSDPDLMLAITRNLNVPSGVRMSMAIGDAE